MNVAVWVERHGLQRPEEPAIADGEHVHADWVTFAARTASVGAGLRDSFGTVAR
jgi:long-chain acyl-CoA synthetase